MNTVKYNSEIQNTSKLSVSGIAGELDTENEESIMK